MTDKPDVFMPLYIGDYLAGTSRLTTELHGAYLLLIMDYWMNGPLPDDDDLLSSITKMSPDAWSIARAKLEKYFSIANGFWKQKRIEEELAAATEKKRKAREKAKKAAAARWDDATSNASSNASAKLKECPSPSPSPSPSPLESIKDKDLVPPNGGTEDYPPEFEEVWKQYPKRAGGNPKKATFKKWQARLKEGVDSKAMLEGVKRYAAYCKAEKKTGTQYVMQGETFFGPSEHYLESYSVSNREINGSPFGHEKVDQSALEELKRTLRQYQ